MALAGPVASEIASGAARGAGFSRNSPLTRVPVEAVRFSSTENRMDQSFRLYRRNNGRYYLEESATGRQTSLRTTSKAVALRLQAAEQPYLNRTGDLRSPYPIPVHFFEAGSPIWERTCRRQLPLPIFSRVTRATYCPERAGNSVFNFQNRPKSAAKARLN